MDHSPASRVSPPLLWAWQAQVTLGPYDPAGWSKNGMWRHDRRRTRLSNIARNRRDALVAALKEQIPPGFPKTNRLWLSIHVSKPDHRSDAINALDLVADAVKVAVGLDDRWFCIRRITWDIQPEHPEITIWIGQGEGVEHVQTCGGCGQIFPLEQCTGSRCRPCAKAGRQELKETRKRLYEQDQPPEPAPTDGAPPPWLAKSG